MNIFPFLKEALKFAVIVRLQKLAIDITPEDIEARIDVTSWLASLEQDPRFAEIQPLFEALEPKAEEMKHAIAHLLDAMLDLLPALVAQCEV